MKKQEQKTIKPSQMTDMVSTHKMKEVAPPSSASRGMDGKYSVDKAIAAQQWFKAAKEQNPSSGFNGVAAEGLDPKTATDNAMLYKGKKK